MSEAAVTDRRFRYAQIAALAVSAFGAVAAGRRVLEAPPVWNDQPADWGRVAGLAALVMVVVIARWPRHAAAAVAIACVIAAAALMTPGPVAVCALLLGSMYIAGRAVLGGAGFKGSAAVAALAGVALVIGLFEVTLRLRVHYPGVHAAIAIGVLILARASLRSELGRAWAALALPRTTKLTERVWLAIAGVVAVVHIVIAARPELGYDASTMHLQFAEHIARDRSFRLGVDRYLWAKMPLGADYLFASGYLLGGEAAARALNLAFGVIAASLAYRLARAFATREVAVASVTLLASMPLAMLVTGSLFSEALWVALLLGSLVVVVDACTRETLVSAQSPAPRANAWIPAFALLAGAAMATKVMSVIWFAVLVPFALWCAYRDGGLRALTRREIGFVAAGIAIGAFPYLDAWVSTGNPVFPFMNSLFRSPLYAIDASFNNPLYNSALTAWTPWDVVLRSARYIEGRDGALGLSWLFAWPLILLHLLRRPAAMYGVVAALAIVFFVLVYTQQSYLRYLLPAFALAAVLAAAPLASVVRGAFSRVLLLVAGIALVAFDIRAISTAAYPLATPCIRCLYDLGARDRLVAEYAPLRTVAARLNRELPRARVGFLALNDPAPAGYVGYSRSGNWHDHAFFPALAAAATPDAIAALVRTHRLTHIVYRVADDPASKLAAEFAATHATPLWREGSYVVAALQPSSGG